MGIPVLRRVADLGDGLVLAPERFDPRRRVEVVARRCLSDAVEIVSENVSARSWGGRARFLFSTPRTPTRASWCFDTIRCRRRAWEV